MNRQHHIGSRRLGLWLGMAALAVQIVLPLLIAVEIRVLSQDPFLFGGYDAALACTHNDNGQPATPKRHDMAACPLCAALAAGHAITLAAATVLPVPRQSVVAAPVVPVPALPVSRHRASYDARGPPARA